MKNTMQKIAVGLVAVLSLILALVGCNDEKAEQQKFQPDSYYENKGVQELEFLCENNDLKMCHKAGALSIDEGRVYSFFAKIVRFHFINTM